MARIPSRHGLNPAEVGLLYIPPCWNSWPYPHDGRLPPDGMASVLRRMTETSGEFRLLLVGQRHGRGGNSF